MVLTRIVVFVVTFLLGIGIVRNAEPIVRSVGHLDWAERTFGAGGSYTAWKIAGVLVMIFGFLYAIGRFDLTPGESLPFLRPTS
ncbi:MAG: hypothetical protein AAB701_03140 [Patescibacteria group bacterium]